MNILVLKANTAKVHFQTSLNIRIANNKDQVDTFENAVQM